MRKRCQLINVDVDVDRISRIFGRMGLPVHRDDLR